MGEFKIEWDFRIGKKVTVTLNEARMSFVACKAFTQLTSSVRGKLYWAWSSRRGVTLPTR